MGWLVFIYEQIEYIVTTLYDLYYEIFLRALHIPLPRYEGDDIIYHPPVRDLARWPRP